MLIYHQIIKLIWLKKCQILNCPEISTSWNENGTKRKINASWQLQNVNTLIYLYFLIILFFFIIKIELTIINFLSFSIFQTTIILKNKTKKKIRQLIKINSIVRIKTHINHSIKNPKLFIIQSAAILIPSEFKIWSPFIILLVSKIMPPIDSYFYGFWIFA